MVEEVKQVKDSVVERIFKSSFFGAWAIAFSVINWRAIYILLFPSGDVLFWDRLDYIDGNLYDDWWEWALKLILLPLTYASLNLALFPRFTLWLDRKRYRAEKTHKNEQDLIDETLTLKQLEIEKMKGAIENEKENSNQLKRKIEEGQHHLYLLLSRVATTNEQMRMNLQALREGRPVNISAGQPDLKVFGLATENEDKTWTITDLGKKVAETLPY